MLRCRKGDMAIIISGAYSGSIVDVVEFYGDSEAVDINGAVGLTENAWIVKGVRKFKGIHRSDRTLLVEDREMLPIRPDELKETEEQEKEMSHE